jgi:hypothetical protein
VLSGEHPREHTQQVWSVRDVPRAVFLAREKIMKHRIAVLTAVAGLASIASAQSVPKVLFSNIAGHPTSNIPGSSGLVFDNGTGTQFDRPHVSPNGNRFLLIASYDAGTSETDNEVVVVGTLNPFAAALVVQEGTPLPFEAGSNYGTFIRTQASINDAGSFLISVDTTAATTADEMLVRFDALTNTWDAPQREGQPHGLTSATIPSPTWGSVNCDANILANGSIAGRASTFTGTGGSTKQLLHINGTILGETDVTTIAGQLVAPDQTLDAWTTVDRFRTSADGTKWIGFGDLNGPTTTDAFMIVNGTIVAQEGAQLPVVSGLPNVGVFSGDAGSNLISPNGNHWVFRTGLADGTGATSTDVVVKTGAVVARTDAPITNEVGQTELFDDAIFGTTFFLNAINDNGDIVVGGVTNAADVAANAVLVLNGERVIAREGDGVDLDGNGQADEDLFISVFNNDDCFLTADRKFYFQVDLRNGAGVSAGQALLVKDLNAAPPVVCSDIDVNNDGSLFDPVDIDAFLSVFSEGPCVPETNTCDSIDFNNDGSLFDPCDIDSFLLVFSEGPCTLCGV